MAKEIIDSVEKLEEELARVREAHVNFLPILKNR